VVSIDDRLGELGLVLPQVPPPAGNYRHAVRSGHQLLLAAKGSLGRTGKVGSEVSVAEGYAAAREAALILIAVLRDELGSLERVARIVKVSALVNADHGFADHPSVVDGCSDLLVEVFGERGRHARSAAGAASLPGGATVAIDLVAEIRS